MTKTNKPSAIKYIDIIRHAQSEANAGLPVSDPYTVPLTELGHRQAQALKHSFNAQNPPGLIVTSAMLRTKQTAAPTVNLFKDVPQDEWPMHEITYLEPTRHLGTTFEEREPDKRIYWQRLDPDYVDGPNAESFNQFISRVDDMAERIKALEPEYTVIFSHGFVMRALWQRLVNPQLNGQALMLATKSKKITGDMPNTAKMSLAVHNGHIHIVPSWSAHAKCA